MLTSLSGLMTAVMSPGSLVGYTADAHEGAKAAPTYPEHQDLSYYLDAAGSRHPIETATHWQIRRAHVLAQMQRVTRELPGNEKRVPLEVKQVEEEQVGWLLRSELIYQVELGDHVMAYLFLPSRKGKRKIPPPSRCFQGFSRP
jgi:hypothetical protein